MNIYDYLYPRFKFPKNHKIKLFESFSGIGCQKMALERLTDNYEVVGISEIDKYAINSYMAMHGETKNFGDISKLSGGGIPKVDIFTYSFPCTDLSKVGKQKGLNNTRSGLVYEVLRLLHEMQELDKLPKVLVMENVIDLVQTKFIREFNEIQLEIEQMGYKNYTKILNAQDYGIPQMRMRVFMVSVLGDYNYKFPTPIPLQTRVGDYLESNVSERYYISEKLYKCFTDMTDRNGFIRGKIFKPIIKDDIAFTLTTSGGTRATDNFISNGDIKPIGNGKMNIRKLTPLESWRLMGIDDEYFYKAKEVNSNTQLYKQAGNGIVVDVLEAMFKELME
jgi:DNA (cytosine-5)-methyltransferase 1